MTPWRRSEAGCPRPPGSELAALAGALVFVEAARRARRQRVGACEARLFHAVNDLPDAIHMPAWLVMQFGSLGSVGVTALAAWRAKQRSAAAGLVASGFAVWALCKPVKRLIGRGRSAAHLQGVRIRGRAQRGLGFPSGHAGVSVALATVANNRFRTEITRALWAAAAVVGIARMYVGAHLPLDVLGGAALGLSAGAATNLVLARAAPDAL